MVCASAFGRGSFCYGLTAGYERSREEFQKTRRARKGGGVLVVGFKKNRSFMCSKPNELCSLAGGRCFGALDIGCGAGRGFWAPRTRGKPGVGEAALGSHIGSSPLSYFSRWTSALVLHSSLPPTKCPTLDHCACHPTLAALMARPGYPPFPEGPCPVPVNPLRH